MTAAARTPLQAEESRSASSNYCTDTRLTIAVDGCSTATDIIAAGRVCPYGIRLGGGISGRGLSGSATPDAVRHRGDISGRTTAASTGAGGACSRSARPRGLHLPLPVLRASTRASGCGAAHTGNTSCFPRRCRLLWGSLEGLGCWVPVTAGADSPSTVSWTSAFAGSSSSLHQASPPGTGGGRSSKITCSCAPATGRPMGRWTSSTQGTGGAGLTLTGLSETVRGEPRSETPCHARLTFTSPCGAGSASPCSGTSASASRHGCTPGCSGFSPGNADKHAHPLALGPLGDGHRCHLQPSARSALAAISEGLVVGFHL